MGNRLEILRWEIDRLIMEKQEDKCKYFFIHLYGVSNFCVLLALKRGLDPELAAACGMLHDIYQITDGIIEQHGVKGAEKAGHILKTSGLYSSDEIDIITTAISRHSKKRKNHDGAYDELLKDADVLSHCFYDPDDPIIEKEALRYNNLLIELGCIQSGQ